MGLFDKLFKKTEDTAERSKKTDDTLRAMISGGSAAGLDDGPAVSGCAGCSGCGGGCDPASCGGPVKKEEEETEVLPLGWDAITKTFEAYYPEQTSPLRLTPEIPWSEGGEDPLESISVYDGKEYFHMVTYGLSELYEKESDNMAYSGYGFEFTVKLKKAGLGTTPEEINGELRHMGQILQTLARETFRDGRMFVPEECIYNGRTEGIDSRGASNIVGFITRLDNAGVVETPNGWVKFTELIGVTKSEIEGIEQGWITAGQLYEALGSDCTDYNRISMM